MIKKIWLDATPIRSKPSGIGFYALNLIQALLGLRDSGDFIFNVFYQPAFKKFMMGDLSPFLLIKDFDPVCLPLPVTFSSWLSRWPNNFILSYYARVLGDCDLIHGTDNVVYPIPLAKKVMTIFDLSFIRYPDYSPLIVQTYYERLRCNLKYADLVITISENSKRDIVECLGFPAEKIYVTYLAGRNMIPGVCPSGLYDFSFPYLLFVGTIEPRKNIISIIRAFNELKKIYEIPHNLVLIGQKGWKYQPIFEAIAGSPWSDQIYHLDYLPDAMVAYFYARASVFIYPSFYEGFGLPVLEAMSLGTPVIASNSSSLGEVVNGAGVMIDPCELDELVDAIWRIINDSVLAGSLIRLGKEQALRFSWNQTAQATLCAYQSLV